MAAEENGLGGDGLTTEMQDLKQCLPLYKTLPVIQTITGLYICSQRMPRSRGDMKLCRM